ncbi:MAG: nucleoside kinase, partial [Kiritimatiellaeota bacterium]|nr:nucleoside kinase [Kiritimatiellota bacterium]
MAKSETSQRIRITLDDGRVLERRPPVLVGDLLASPTATNGLEVLGAMVNNDVYSLSYPLDSDSTVTFFTAAEEHGWRMYVRSLCFLLAKAVRDVFPQANFTIEHSLATGYFCNFSMGEQSGIKPGQVHAIERRMRELVAADLPVERRKLAYTDALTQFEHQRQPDKFHLLDFRNPNKVVINWCEGFSDLAHGVVVEHTGTLGVFKLVPYQPGFVIQFPDRHKPTQVAPFRRRPQLFQIFQEHKRWGRILGVSTVGKLNELIVSGGIRDFIKIAEALHEKKIAQLADQITARRDHTRWVLIAGPSSSGKTTFAKRLTVQLQVNGLRPITLSTDDYFVNRALNPLDADGKPDFEHLDAIDLPLLQANLGKLDRGEEIEPPRFNFETGQRVFRGDRLKLEEGQLVVMEGTHALNPQLTASIPVEHKFRIYVSALTQLNLDCNTRISTTDNRLVRRLVRDHQFRGHNALETLQMWPNVQRGERRWIFPFQSAVDAAFNSALDYELAVLKLAVEPILAGVKPTHPEYAEARRLQEFLGCFLGISDQ